MSAHEKLRRRLANLKHEETQLKARIKAYEALERKLSKKGDPQKWYEASRELKSLREKHRENTRRQEEIRDVLGE